MVWMGNGWQPVYQWYVRSFYRKRRMGNGWQRVATNILHVLVL